MDKGKIKHSLSPDSRKILLFLVIAACVAVIIVAGPSLFPEGSSAEIVFMIPQSLLGLFLTVVTAPFGEVAAIFRASGFYLFYSTGSIAKVEITLGIVVTVIWCYVLSCIVISICRSFKGGGVWAWWCAHTRKTYGHWFRVSVTPNSVVG